MVRECHDVSGGAEPAAGGESWLAGAYEVNAVGEAWLGYDVLAWGTTWFSGKAEACSALGVSFEGTRSLPRIPVLWRGRGGCLASCCSTADTGRGSSLRSSSVRRTSTEPA